MCRWPPPARTQARVASATCSGVPVRSNSSLTLPWKVSDGCAAAAAARSCRMPRLITSAPDCVIDQVRALLDEQDARRLVTAAKIVWWCCCAQFHVLVGVEHPGPRVEQLVDVGAVGYERGQEMDRRRFDPVEQCFPDARLLGGEAAGRVHVLAGADAVGRHGERRPGEDKHRQLAVQLLSSPRQAGRALAEAVGVGSRAQPIDVGEGPNRPIRHRPAAGLQA